MDRVWVIFVILMIVASLLEQAGRKKGQPPVPPRRPPRREPLPGTGSETPQQTGRASDMLSEELWRELTGGAPRRPAPPPPVQPDLPSFDEEAVARVEAPAGAEASVRPLPPAEPWRRPEVIRPQPVIVSLEAPLPAPEQRHAQFHRRAQEVEEKPLPQAAGASLTLTARLRRRENLRDAFVLAEVFGVPKGLEQESGPH